MNTEEKIQHVEALNHVTHDAEHFLIKGNYEYAKRYHYRIKDKWYYIHLEMKEETDDIKPNNR